MMAASKWSISLFVQDHPYLLYEVLSKTYFIVCKQRNIMYDFCFVKTCTKRRSCYDVTDQQAAHGSREAADSYHAHLHRQFYATYPRLERIMD